MPRHLNPQIDIIQLNVNSIVSHLKRTELNLFLKLHNPHAVLLCETVLNNTHNVVIPRYNIERHDKIPNNPGRGTAILVKNGTKYSRINTASWNLKTLEVTAVLVQTTRQPILLIAAYRFNQTSPLDPTDLDTIAAARNLLGPGHTIIGGDFNARHHRWFNTFDCPSGRALDQWIQNPCCNYKMEFPLEPTFYRSSYTSFLDLFLVDSDLNVVYEPRHANYLEILDFPSDHRAVRLTIQLQGNILSQAPRKVLCYDKTDWHLFRSTLDNNINDFAIPNHRNASEREIDAAIEHISLAISATMVETIPTAIIKPGYDSPLPDHINNLLLQKHRLRSQWKRQRYNNGAHLLMAQIRDLTSIIKGQLAEHKRESWVKRLQNVKLDHRTFKNISQLSGTNKRTPIPDLSSANNVKASSAQEKASLLGNHFSDVHRQNTNLGDPDFVAQIVNEVKSEFDLSVEPLHTFSPNIPASPIGTFNHNTHLVSMESLLEIIKSRATKPSKGPDGIPSLILKKLSLKCCALLATIINQAYNASYFPIAWKSAIVVPIPKRSKPPADPKSYRPIALLSSLSKIYERATLTKLNTTTEGLGLIPADQYGFRLHRDAPQAAVRVHTDVTTKINAKTPTIAVLLDVEKAFDTVWKEGLIYKMRHLFHIPPHLCRIIHSYLSSRSFKVTVNDAVSPSFDIAAGVPQGGVLSATLYNIYLADLPPPPAEINPIKRAQFADDIIVYLATKSPPSGQRRLNAYLKTIAEFMTRWQLRLSPEKTEAIVFKGPSRFHTKRWRREIKLLTLSVCGRVLPLEKEIKYLGVTMREKPSSIGHLIAVKAKANNALKALSKVLRTTNGLGIRVKMLCYKQLVRPILAYGFPAWCIMSSHQMELLRRLERRCLRICLRGSNHFKAFTDQKTTSNKLLYEEAAYYNIERIDRFLIKLALRFFERAACNEALEDISTYENGLLDSAYNHYPPPWMLQHLHNTGRLLDEHGTPIFYHRRHLHPDGTLVYSKAS